MEEQTKGEQLLQKLFGRLVLKPTAKSSVKVGHENKERYLIKKHKKNMFNMDYDVGYFYSCYNKKCVRFQGMTHVSYMRHIKGIWELPGEPDEIRQ